MVLQNATNGWLPARTQGLSKTLAFGRRLNVRGTSRHAASTDQGSKTFLRKSWHPKPEEPILAKIIGHFRKTGKKYETDGIVPNQIEQQPEAKGLDSVER